MSDFGHTSMSAPGFHIDAWGVGPFYISPYRFEDSDRFGPYFVTLSGREAKKSPAERDPFWAKYTAWRRQGRRLASDGIACVWDPLKPTIVKRVAPRSRHFVVVENGDDGGETIILASDTGPGDERHG